MPEGTTQRQLPFGQRLAVLAELRQLKLTPLQQAILLDLFFAWWAEDQPDRCPDTPIELHPAEIAGRVSCGLRTVQITVAGLERAGLIATRQRCRLPTLLTLLPQALFRGEVDLAAMRRPRRESHQPAPRERHEHTAFVALDEPATTSTPTVDAVLRAIDTLESFLRSTLPALRRSVRALEPVVAESNAACALESIAPSAPSALESSAPPEPVRVGVALPVESNALNDLNERTSSATSATSATGAVVRTARARVHVHEHVHEKDISHDHEHEKDERTSADALIEEPAVEVVDSPREPLSDEELLAKWIPIKPSIGSTAQHNRRLAISQARIMESPPRPAPTQPEPSSDVSGRSRQEPAAPPPPSPAPRDSPAAGARGAELVFRPAPGWRFQGLDITPGSLRDQSWQRQAVHQLKRGGWGGDAEVFSRIVEVAIRAGRNPHGYLLTLLRSPVVEFTRADIERAKLESERRELAVV